MGVTDKGWFWSGAFLLLLVLFVVGAVALFALQRKCAANGGHLRQKYWRGPVECVR